MSRCVLCLIALAFTSIAHAESFTTDALVASNGELYSMYERVATPHCGNGVAEEDEYGCDFHASSFLLRVDRFGHSADPVRLAATQMGKHVWPWSDGRVLVFSGWYSDHWPTKPTMFLGTNGGLTAVPTALGKLNDNFNGVSIIGFGRTTTGAIYVAQTLADLDYETAIATVHRIDFDGNDLGPTFDLPSQVPFDGHVEVAPNGDGNVLGWWEPTGNRDGTFYVARVANDGTLLDPEGIALGTGSELHLAGEAHGFAASIVPSYPSTDAAAVTFFDVAGTIVGQWSADAHTSVEPLFANDDGYCLAWLDDEPNVLRTFNPQPLRGRVLDANGAVVGGPFELAALAYPQLSVTSIGSTCYVQFEAKDSSLQIARWDRTGPLGTTTIATPSGCSAAPGAPLTSEGLLWLVAVMIARVARRASRLTRKVGRAFGASSRASDRP